MRIRKAFPINPMVWAVHFFLKFVKPLVVPAPLPSIQYVEEFMFKSPQRTYSERKGNCINRAIMLYAYTLYREWVSGGMRRAKYYGVTYLMMGGKFHSDYLELDDADLDEEGDTHLYYLIDKDAIYEMLV